MKPRLLSAARLSFPLASALAALLAVPTAKAVVWDSGAGNGNWGNGTNWSTDSVPGANSLIEFSSASGSQTGIYIGAARTVSGINFLSGNSASQNIEFSTQPNNTGTAVDLTFNSTNTGILVADGRTHIIGNSLTGADGNIVLLGNLAVATTSGTLTLNRPVTGSFSLTKTGTGTLNLTAANLYTGTTAVNGGTLNLGNGTAAGSLASTTLSLGGGNLNYSRTGGTTQSFTTTNITAGVSAVSAASGNILNLGTISRTGGTIDFSSVGAGTVVALVGSNVNGVIPGATFGSTWAVANGANIAISGLADGAYTLTSVAGNTAGNYTNFNIDVDDNAGLLSGVITPSSLRFNANAANSVTLAAGSNVINSGIMVTSAVGNNLSTISGGNLTSAPSSDLIISQQNTSNGLTISSAIVNNTSTGLIKLGAGLLTLSNTNTYSGATNVSSGTLVLSAANTISGATSVAGTATLQLGHATSMGSSTMTLASGATLQLRNDVNTTFTAPIATPATSVTYNFDVNQATGAGSAKTLTLGNITFATSSSNVINVTGGNSYALALGTLSTPSGAGGNTFQVNATSAAVTIAKLSVGSFGNAVTLQGGNAITLSSFEFGANGTSSLTVSGVNTVVNLGAAAAINSRSGGSVSYTLASGTLNLTNVRSLANVYNSTPGSPSTPSFTITSGTLNNTSGAALALTANGGTVYGSPNTTINGDFTYGTAGSTNLNDLNLGLGTVSLGTSAGTTRTVTVNGATNLTLGGIISNGTTANSLAKAGTGTLTLSGTNGYTSATSISGGTLALSGTGAVNTSSGITVNGSGAKFLQTSSVAVTPAVTLTQGTVTGSGTVNTVNAANTVNAIISNNNGVAGASLTIGALTFSGAATVNTFSSNTTAPIITTTLASNAAGTVTINPTAASWTVDTPHDLISYGGGSIGGGGFGQFALGTVTGITARQTKTLGNSGTAITLTIGTNDSPVWSGAGSQTWTTATNGDNTGPNDWALLSAQTATNFWAGDTVQFNDTYNLGAGALAVSNSTVTITGGVAPLSTVFNNSAVNYTINSSDSTGITSGSITKNGTGNLTINTANTYTGATTLNAGILRATTNATALGAGTLTLAGGELQLANDTGLNFGRNTTVTGNAQITSDTLTAVAGGTHTLGALSIGGQTLTIAKGSNATSTTAGVTFGATTLTGAPTFSIGTGSNLTLAAVTNAGNTITLTGAGNFSQTGTLSGAGGLILNSGFSGTATLSGASTNYSGVTTISGGKLVLSSTTAFASAVTVNAGTTLQYSPTAVSSQNGVGAISLLGTLAYAPAGNFYQVLGTNKIVTVSGGASIINISPGGTFAASTGGLYLDGGLQGSSALTVNATTDGFGLILRNASSTYNGTMTVNGTASTTPGTGSGLVIGFLTTNATMPSANLTINGTLELGNSTSGMGWAGGATTGLTFGMDALNGTGVIVANMQTAASTRTISVGNNGGTGNFSGVIANGVNNTLSFTKAGSGTQTLSGMSATAGNNYSGTTTINNGTLAFTTTSPSLTGGLAFGGAAANTTPGILDLSSANATFGGALLVNTNSATANEIKIGSSQTLTINNNVQIGATAPALPGTVTKLNMTGGGVLNVSTPAAGTFIVGGSTSTTNTSQSTLDLSALASTSINASATGTIRVSNNTGTSTGSNQNGTKATFILPTPTVLDTALTTTLTAGTLGVGINSSFNSVAGQINTLQLGTGLTTLNADTINVGTGGRDIGQIIFGQAGGDLKIRAADTTSRATALNVGTGGAGTGTTEATTNNLVDFSSHDADILVTSLNVGNQARVGSLTSEFKFGAGDASLASVLDATNVNIGFRTGTATTASILTNRVAINGGTVTFGNVGATGTGVDIGNSTYSGALAASTIGELNISGGNVTINNSTTMGAAVRIGTNTSAAGGTVTASLNLTGGTTTLGGDIIKGTATGTVSSTLTLNGASATLDMGGKNITNLTGITYTDGTLKNLGVVNTGITLAGTGSRVFDQATGVNGTIQGAITGSSLGLTKQGDGNLTLAGTNTYTGTTTISGGQLTIDDGSIATSSSIVNNAALEYKLNTNARTYANEISGSGTLTKTGTNTLTLTGVNTYTGATTISGGQVTIDDGSIATSSSIVNDTALEYKLNTNARTYANVISGSGTLTKTGTNTLTLTAANTYSGSTSVTAGTLLVNNTTGSGTGSGAVIIGANGTLGGSGIISGNTTIDGKHNAGNPAVASGVGTQTFGGNLGYGNDSIFNWDLNANKDANGLGGDDGVAGTDFDSVAVAGDLNVGTNAVFNVILGTGVTLGNSFWSTPYITQEWSMAAIFGKTFTSGSFASVISTADPVTQGSFTLTGSGSTLTWTAVPEPTSAVAGLLIGAGLLRRRRSA